MRQFDVLLAQTSMFDPPPLPPDRPPTLMWPHIYFPAFHPDIVYVRSRTNGAFINSPVGPYNSSLALFGFLSGRSAAATLNLFNRETMEAFGFDQFADSREALFCACEQIEFPISDAFMKWIRRGCFMHTINHPKLYVIEDLARIVLQKLNIPVRNEPSGDYLIDNLQGIVWPVYPDIGETLGIQGGYTFKRSSECSPHPRYLDLEDVVFGSFEIYQTYDRDDFVCDRVSQWLSTTQTM